MRIDKTVTLIMSKFLRNRPDNKITILMYHSITPVLSNKKHPYFSIETTPDTFEKQLKCLKAEGYQIIRLADIFKKKNESGKKNIVLTFDDGYSDFYKYALPIIKKHGFTATVFIPSGLIGNNNNNFLEGKELMNWDQIYECRKHNIEFASHSLNHRVLTNLSYEELENDINESKKIIERKLNVPISLFAYPYKFPEENRAFIENLIRLLKKYEFSHAVTTRIGRARSTDSLFTLKRIPINEYDDEQFFKAKINGAYDWLYYLQLMKKKMRLL